MFIETSLSFSDLKPWEEGPLDYRWASKIVIWCQTAPSVPYEINCGSETIMIPQHAEKYDRDGKSTTSIVDSEGRYVIEGHCWMNLQNGSDGIILISAYK